MGSSPLTRGKRSKLHRLANDLGLIPAHAGKTRSQRDRATACPAHPRSRGENSTRPRVLRGVVGSSPLTRGKRRQHRLGRGHLGLIPAHAGKTGQLGRRRQGSGAHPRSRGENNADAWFAVSAGGSSPLTRGKHQGGGRRRRRMGLIPAHAGKTVLARLGGADAEAHPRSRGENTLPSWPPTPCEGSSPLTRGKRVAVFYGLLLSGLIPAHAGKTSRATSITNTAAAHPRSRGENKAAPRVAAVAEGSSPLTRGKRTKNPGGEVLSGLIPAHAGKTPKPKKPCVPRRAHPRSRGENAAASAVLASVRGSSPLTRGKPRPRLRSRSRQRLIPAHAGKTPSRASLTVLARAHPRSRGENTETASWWISRTGSSPLTRGKQRGGGLGDGELGLIPAHAGKTRWTGDGRTSRAAHPRSRGENLIGVAADLAAQGSSPLTRGKQITDQHLPMPHRLIPAHAGKTRPGGPHGGGARAHPRSRGENMQAAMQLTRDNGSSPLTRGKRDRPPKPPTAPRLIPAHAGKTLTDGHA